MKRGTRYYAQCAQPRNKLAKHGTLDLATGEHVVTSEEWEIGVECGTPLFSQDREAGTGRCKSCSSGWTHPGNFPVEGPMIAPPFKVGG